jgi:hypothetical protein
MDIDVNDDPSLPDWDGDAELTPWQQMLARISMQWARVASDHDGLHHMEAIERAARLLRRHMTPRERAEDDRARMRVTDLVRPHACRDAREYLRSQGGMLGLTNPDPTQAEVVAARRVRSARLLGMDEQAQRRYLYHEDHDGLDPDELLDPEALAMARSTVEAARDQLQRWVAERPLTYAEILSAHPSEQVALLARDGQRVYHVLVVGDDGVRDDAEARMPAARIANPPRDPIYDGVRGGSDGPTLYDMLWPMPEVQVERLHEVVAEVTGVGGNPVAPKDVKPLALPPTYADRQGDRSTDGSPAPDAAAPPARLLLLPGTL